MASRGAVVGGVVVGGVVVGGAVVGGGTATVVGGAATSSSDAHAAPARTKPAVMRTSECFMAAIVRIAAHPVVGLPAACAAARVHPGMYGELSQRPTTAAARERTVAPWNS